MSPAPRILVLDGSRVVSRRLKTLLEGHGYEVLRCDSQEAIAFCRELGIEIDLVIAHQPIGPPSDVPLLRLKKPFNCATLVREVRKMLPRSPGRRGPGRAEAKALKEQKTG